MKLKFVDLGKLGFLIEPRYYFFGWTDSRVVLARASLAVALGRAERLLPRGHRFKVWDCQRPLEVQKKMINSFRRRLIAAHPNWSAQQIETALYTFATRPKKVVTRLDHHRTGGAIDLTIVDADGRELWMGTDHDDLTPRAAMDYFERRKPSRPMDRLAKKNRRVLKKAMLTAGFYSYAPEWWHFGYEK